MANIRVHDGRNSGGTPYNSRRYLGDATFLQLIKKEMVRFLLFTLLIKLSQCCCFPIKPTTDSNNLEVSISK